MHPSRNLLHRPLTLRTALVCAGAAVVLAGLILAWPRLRHWWEARPKSPEGKIEAVFAHLKRRSGRSDFKSGYDFDLRGKVALLQSNALHFRTEVSLLQTNLTALEQELRALNREVTAAADAGRAARRQLNAAAKGPAAAREEAEREDRARQAELEAKRAKLAERQSDLKALQARLNAAQKAAQAARREAATAEQALAQQGADFSRDMRKAIKDAGSYEAIYAAIGQWLWTGRRLLESADPRVQRQGAQCVDEAAQAAMRGAEDAGLAALICEALVWPNLARFDLPGQGTAAADSVLGNCRDVFQRAGATNLLERNYALMLEHASTPRRKDSIRFSLGSFHEDAGAWQAALDVYRQIEDTNYTAQAQRRIEVVERKRAQGR